MTVILLIGNAQSRHLFLQNLSRFLGQSITDSRQITSDCQQDNIDEDLFYGVEDVSCLPTHLKYTVNCGIHITFGFRISDDKKRTEVFQNFRPTYVLGHHEISSSTFLEEIKNWLSTFDITRPIRKLETRERKITALREAHEFQILQQEFIAYTEELEFQNLQQQFISQKRKHIDAHEKSSLVTVSPPHFLQMWRSPSIQKLGMDMKNIDRQHAVQLTQDQFEYIITELERFVQRALFKSYYSGEWKSYCRYFAKASSEIPDTKKSFFIFTKKLEPEQFYIIIKSNIHISGSWKTEQGDMLWAAGSTKQIKLHGLLLKFRLARQKIIPDPRLPLCRIVTFTHPSSLKIDLASTTKEARLAQKFTAMNSLIRRSSQMEDFSHWDGILLFQDTQNNQRMLAYQQYGGNALTHEIVSNWSIKEKIYAILSLFKDLKTIICEQNTWPSDIKIQNFLYKKTPRSENYNLYFTDFRSRVNTYTFLKYNQSNYNHPIYEHYNAPEPLRVSDYQFCCGLLDQRQHNALSNTGARLKCIAYHMSFELILCTFFMMYPVIHKAYSNMFNFNDAWIEEKDLVQKIDVQMNKHLTAARTIQNAKFLNLLIKYTYHHDFLYKRDSTAADVLTEFFHDIRSEFLVNFKPHMPPASADEMENPDSNEQCVFSNRWIQTVAEGFLNLKNTPPSANTIPLENLEPLQ